MLGPLEVLDDDGNPVDVGGARPRTLLVDLALAQGRAVPAEQLLEDVWSGEQIPARNNLQVHVSRLRRVLGDDRITTQGGGYALDLPRDAIDVARFDRLAAEGRAALHAGDAEVASRTLAEALQLWRGAALADFVDEQFARPVITRLEESRLVAIEDRIEADLVLGRHAALVGEVEALLIEHSLRERLWAELMTALYRSGRQGEALRAYQRARTVLADELGIDPGPELQRLERSVLAQDPSLSAPVTPSDAGASPAGAPTNLPAPTSALVGRAAEIDATVNLVHHHRLVTIVGPGGVGKTRLAIEIGRTFLGQFRDGVWVIDLAPVGDPSDVATAVAAALGVETEVGAGAASTTLERLSEFLSGREALLVFDNCEHVVGESARITDQLLARCGALHVLATSREPLMIAGEALWPLAPLDLEDATELFVTRARAAAPAFGLDDDAGEQTARVVRAICERLDGLPLAIELAAARMRAFTPGDLLARLEDRFRLLTGGSRTAFPRQQTMRAVVDWSYDLLFDDERRVFERVSVFAGAFTITAAEAVCADDVIRADAVAGLLARLVDKSLVVPANLGEQVRFRLLQTLAQYGRERLVASGDGDAVGARHAHHLVRLLEVPDGVHGADTGSWFRKVGESIDDIRVRDGLGHRRRRRRHRARADEWPRLVLEHGWAGRRHVALADDRARAR